MSLLECSDNRALRVIPMAESTLQAGQMLEQRYRIVSDVGSGATGSVYLAFEAAFDRQVAIKVLHNWNLDSDQSGKKRLEREAQALSLLRHPNIVQIYRFGFFANQDPYLVMEYVPGQSLRSLLDKEKTLNLADVLSIALPVADALRHAHSQGVLHRDLKPENIIIGDTAKTVKLVDFGLSRREEGYSAVSFETHGQALTPKNLTQTGELIGTPLYMSPEQCQGHPVSQASDIYAFGCVLYEMIVGSPPFPTEDLGQLMMNHITKPMPRLLEQYPNCGLPRELQDIVLRCTEKNPDSRYEDFAEIVSSLNALQKHNGQARIDLDAPVVASSSRIPQLVSRAKKINVFTVVGIACVALTCVVLVIAGSKMLQSPDEKAPPPVLESQQLIRDGHVHMIQWAGNENDGHTAKALEERQAALACYRAAHKVATNARELNSIKVCEALLVDRDDPESLKLALEVLNSNSADLAQHDHLFALSRVSEYYYLQSVKHGDSQSLNQAVSWIKKWLDYEQVEPDPTMRRPALAGIYLADVYHRLGREEDCGKELDRLMRFYVPALRSTCEDGLYARYKIGNLYLDLSGTSLPEHKRYHHDGVDLLKDVASQEDIDNPYHMAKYVAAAKAQLRDGADRASRASKEYPPMFVSTLQW
jgi:serine/threonine protein kinase